MASKSIPTSALLLTLNILFFTLVSANNSPCPPPPPTPCPPPPKKHAPTHPPPSPIKPSPTPTPIKPSPTPPTPIKPSPTPPKKATCPRDTLKLAVCGNVLNGLLNIIIGTPPKEECCGLISGLVDLDAALCLCTAIKANVLGINLDVPVSLSLLLNLCGKKLPSGFQCN